MCLRTPVCGSRLSAGRRMDASCAPGATTPRSRRRPRRAAPRLRGGPDPDGALAGRGKPVDRRPAVRCARAACSTARGGAAADSRGARTTRARSSSTSSGSAVRTALQRPRRTRRDRLAPRLRRHAGDRAQQCRRMRAAGGEIAKLAVSRTPSDLAPLVRARSVAAGRIVDRDRRWAAPAWRRVFSPDVSDRAGRTPATRSRRVRSRPRGCMQDFCFRRIRPDAAALRRHRPSGDGLALARDAQRGIRARGIERGLRAARRATPTTCSRSVTRSASARRERHDSVQGRR